MRVVAGVFADPFRYALKKHKNHSPFACATRQFSIWASSCLVLYVLEPELSLVGIATTYFTTLGAALITRGIESHIDEFLSSKAPITPIDAAVISKKMDCLRTMVNQIACFTDPQIMNPETLIIPTLAHLDRLGKFDGLGKDFDKALSLMLKIAQHSTLPPADRLQKEVRRSPIGYLRVMHYLFASKDSVFILEHNKSISFLLCWLRSKDAGLENPLINFMANYYAAKLLCLIHENNYLPRRNVYSDMMDAHKMLTAIKYADGFDVRKPIEVLISGIVRKNIERGKTIPTPQQRHYFQDCNLLVSPPLPGYSP